MLFKCTNCQIEANKDRDPKLKNHFCSRSCANSYHNKNYPADRYEKRKKIRFCRECNCQVKTRHLRCKDCTNKITNGDIPLSQVIYTRHHLSSAYALVRSRARKIAKDLGWNKCSNCHYNKHVEIAHIKAIGDFPQDTLISIINSVDNLKPLCPNCHWEFDNLK